MNAIRPTWLLIFVWLFCCLLVSTLPTRAQAQAIAVSTQPLYNNALSEDLFSRAVTYASPKRAFQQRSRQAAASPIMAGCASKSNKEGATFFAGGWSHCIGGRLSLTEQRIKAIDYGHAHMDSAAYAMQSDPRSVMQAPMSATAGIAVPMSAGAHIGIEYSYTEPVGATPFHFRSNGGPADEVVGHSATVRIGLQL